MAATSDRDVMTQLTLTNKKLVQTIHQLTEQLGKAQAELAQAKQQQVPKKNQTPTPNRHPTMAPAPNSTIQHGS
jgi:prephenate dehydrogenase